MIIRALVLPAGLETISYRKKKKTTLDGGIPCFRAVLNILYILFYHADNPPISLFLHVETPDIVHN